MNVSERIGALRKLMAEKGIDVYIVPTADYHQSEYVGDHFKAREFMTGFTGSAGTAVFTMDEANLWTDGRYFLQASKQLAGSEIQLRKMGTPGVLKIEEYIKEVLPEGGCVGFDGRTVGIAVGKEYEKAAQKKEGSVVYQEDLIDQIWKSRPELSKEKAFRLDEQYAGESVTSKLERVREKMRKSEANYHVITSLDDIGWLLNIRGNDVQYFPLLLSYVLVGTETVELYVDETKFDSTILNELAENRVNLHPYDEVYTDIQKLTDQDTVMVDPARVNFALYRNIPKDTKIVECENPTILMKAVKNETEVANIRKAHMKDGVAHTKFMYWLKQNIGKIPMTEISVSDKLEEFRAEQEHFLGPSFGPISAYGEHGAIVHYSATEESNAELKPKGLFMTDTGGHYLEGSTDITRTVALGELTQEEIDDFTMVVAGMLELADVVFLKGCSGMNLDYAARAPFWRKHKEFNHGTGHGVGYLGNIHEPPILFNWKFRPENHPLEANMVITDEPGIYIEGSHGIRTENELLICQEAENEYGEFLRFEPITLVPIDLDALDPEQLTGKERQLLNAYHKKVYEAISPYLTAEEKEWLKIYTREI